MERRREVRDGGRMVTTSERKLPFYVVAKLVGLALAPALVFPAFPSLWLWLIGSAAALLVLMFVIKTPATRALVVGAAIVLATYSYVLGRLYYNGRGLDSPGSFMLMSAFLFVVFLVVYVGVTESRPGSST